MITRSQNENLEPEGDGLHAKDFTSSSQKWRKGVVAEITRPLSFKINFNEGSFAHTEMLRKGPLRLVLVSFLLRLHLMMHVELLRKTKMCHHPICYHHHL